MAEYIIALVELLVFDPDRDVVRRAQFLVDVLLKLIRDLVRRRIKHANPLDVRNLILNARQRLVKTDISMGRCMHLPRGNNIPAIIAAHSNTVVSARGASEVPAHATT